MSRQSSPYILGDYWLDKRRDGKAPNTWQIARKVNRSIVYRSTHCASLEDAKGSLEAFVDGQRAYSRQDPRYARVVPLLMTYWHERGKNAVNQDQTARSLRTFMAFLAQDRAGAHAVVMDLTPSTFERFRAWRMGVHAFEVPWGGEMIAYRSKGVLGATVQRNVNDIRAAIYYAEDNMRILGAPRIHDVDSLYASPLRPRVLTVDEMARIAWYASHSPSMFRFVTLQFATAVRPMAAAAFIPVDQYDDATGLIDLQPFAAPQTKKRNAIVPAIRPLRPILRAWARDKAPPVVGHKTAWRIMRRVLGLSPDVYPKTIRHTIATLLYADETVPEREVVELLGHEGKLARTTRIYAKYSPARLSHATKTLCSLWLRISRLARAYRADHLLTTVGQGGMNIVTKRSATC